MLERVALDSSALLGRFHPQLIGLVIGGYYQGFWSSWIVAEFARKRTEWIAIRAVRDGCDLAELRRRLSASRQRVNFLLRDMSSVLRTVDYAPTALPAVEWLRDPDDLPILQTAIAARCDTLITENSTDFPVGTERDGILFLTPETFITAIFQGHPTAQMAANSYLRTMQRPRDP